MIPDWKKQRVERGTGETRQTMSWELLKLGDGHIGLCSRMLSVFYLYYSLMHVPDMSHNEKNFFKLRVCKVHTILELIWNFGINLYTR